MKALTLHQPWASLIAFGVKTIETRGWKTTYRGPLAIHAGLKEPEHGLKFPGGWWVWNDRSLRGQPPAKPYLFDPRQPTVMESLVPLPLGAVVATCELVDCVPMVLLGDSIEEPVLEIDGCNLALVEPRSDGVPWCTAYVTDQAPFGYFERGRYAWLLADIKPIGPVPAKGAQGLWEWEGA